MADVEDFVDNLELADWDPTSSLRVSYEGSDYVDGGAIHSFVGNIPEQKKSDVLNSTLLAQLAADKKYDRFLNKEEWYDFYFYVMKNIGWVIHDMTCQRYTAKKESFLLSDIVLDILKIATAMDPTLIQAIHGTILKLEGKSRARDVALKLFESRSSLGKQSNFQIVPCFQDKDGQLTVIFLGFEFETEKTEKNYFFFNWDSPSVKLVYCIESITLNEEVYSKVRCKVLSKLGDKACMFVENLDI